MSSMSLLLVAEIGFGSVVLNDEHAKLAFKDILESPVGFFSDLPRFFYSIYLSTLQHPSREDYVQVDCDLRSQCKNRKRES